MAEVDRSLPSKMGLAEEQGVPAAGESSRTGEIVAAALCCAALLLCLVIANPFVDSAFNDDWSYSYLPFRLAKTGRFEYGGWGSPTIIFQSVWAALFSKVFGFSFDLLRVVTIPFSMGFVVLTYLLARKAGLQRNLAQFAALTLAVSPLFLPLAASFMTEPYACFFSLLCIYGSLCSAEANRFSVAAGWLWVVAIAGICGGSDRQTVWLAPLILLPFLAWVRRSDRRFLVHSALAYAACLLSLGVVLAKFAPKYGPTEISRSRWLSLVVMNGRDAAHYVVSVLLVSALLCLPAILCAQPLWKRIRRRQVVVLSLVCVLVFDYLRSGFGLSLGIAPFLGNVLTSQGVIAEFGGLGTRPLLLRVTVRFAITLFLLFAAAAWMYLAKGEAALGKLSRPAASVFVLFAVPYVLLLIPGSLLTYCYDRYALPLLPLFLICLLLAWQKRVGYVPWMAWACLVVYAGYGIVTTHDHARYLEARVNAAKELAAKGVPALHISAGLERDGWLQLQTTGKVATMLYGIDPVVDYNHFWFWFYSPSIQPDYVVLSSDLALVPKNAVLTVPYTNWMPYSKQAAYVVRREDIPKPKA